jgi:hypothetical protein
MRLLPMLLGTALCFATTNALNAGLQLFDIPADAAGGQLSGGVWYPCNAPRQETIVKGRVIMGTRDCLLSGDKLPLVVISHGRAG